MSPKYVNVVKIIYMLHIFDIIIHNRHDITEIVLEVALNTIIITNDHDHEGFPKIIRLCDASNYTRYKLDHIISSAVT
jgi:hypothetical protein